MASAILLIGFPVIVLEVSDWLVGGVRDDDVFAEKGLTVE